MTAISFCHRRSGPLSARQAFKFSARHSPEFNSSSRYYSSEETSNQDDDGDGVGQKAETKSFGTSKTVKSMAWLINSKPWSRELESSLSSLSSAPSKAIFCQVLRFIKSPRKALDFFNWVQKTGFVHDGQSYFSMLEFLGRARKLNVARNFLFSIKTRSNGNVELEDRFFNSLIRSYGRAGLFQEALKVFSLMKEIGISPSVVTFNSLLLILLKRGRTNMVKSLFDEMLRTYGVSPDTYTFNILIRGFCKNSMVDEGYRYFMEMSRSDVVPDVVSYNTIVDGLCRAGKVRIARNVVNGMIKKSADLHPNVVTYTTLVRGYCMKQDVDEALVVFKEMVSRGLKPNDITFNTLIKGLCEAQRIEKVREILEGAVRNGEFTPDTCTFNTLMNAHCNSGNLNEALNVFEKMRKMKVTPDSATYSVLIRNLCQRGDFERAEQLFDELFEKKLLESDDGCTPLVAAYRPMFEFLCKNGKTNKAERVFRQLMKRGTQDPNSFTILILGNCKEGTFKEGYELLVLMLRRDFLPDFVTYDSLIRGLLQKGEPLLAQQTLEKMLKSSYCPKTSTVHSILAGLVKKGCASESANFIELMLKNKIRQNVNLSTDTVRLLFVGGLQNKALQILSVLYDNGYMVMAEELINFLCQNRKLLEAHKVLLFCLEKRQNVEIDTCNTVIEALCKMRLPSEAFELYYKLVERGKHQQLSCLEDLRTALESGGRSEEAKFVSKRMPKTAAENFFKN